MLRKQQRKAAKKDQGTLTRRARVLHLPNHFITQYGHSASLKYY